MTKLCCKLFGVEPLSPGKEFLQPCLGFQGVCVEGGHYVCEAVRGLLECAIKFLKGVDCIYSQIPRTFANIAITILTTTTIIISIIVTTITMIIKITNNHNNHNNHDNHDNNDNHENQVHPENHENNFDQGMHQSAHWAGRLSDRPGLLGALWVALPSG